MDNYLIDEHKLIYHLDRLIDWQKGKDIYPIYIEIAPSGGCNQRCIFCALDYLKYKPVFLKEKPLYKFLSEISKTGTKSVMFAGEGEPLLHPQLKNFVSFAKKRGLDVAITTNGTLFSEGLAKETLPFLSWVRISLNAATPQTYRAIHRVALEDFHKVLQNIKNTVKIKRKNKYTSTIGVQFLLLNQNYKEAEILAKILKQIGVDYLIIKPYSQHPLSINRLKPELNYQKLLDLEEKLKPYSDKKFNLIFRKKTMLKLNATKPYQRCMGLPFWAYLSASGDLYACSSFLEDERFIYGNIYQEGFTKIWQGEKRKALLKMMQNSWDILNCREVCRLDEINRYLWRLKNPPPHLNFI